MYWDNKRREGQEGCKNIVNLGERDLWMDLLKMFLQSLRLKGFSPKNRERLNG